MENNTES